MNQSDANKDGSGTWMRLADRVAAQDWPKASLYVVATPIGNLGDLSVRAWHALSHCDVIAAEDTRATRVLLDAWGIETPMMPAHRHNEAAAAQAIIERLGEGQRVALVSDAGAPAVSDPGGRIVRAVHAAGHRVVPIAGPSAVIAALMASGATSDENPTFMFAGFIPAKAGTRRKWLTQHATIAAPVVMFETPHRVLDTVQELQEICEPGRLLTLARELSKRHEQVVTMPVTEAVTWLNESSHHRQGEFVLILHEGPAVEASEHDAQVLRLLDALMEAMSLRDAAKVAAKATGVSREALYRVALSRKADN